MHSIVFHKLSVEGLFKKKVLLTPMSYTPDLLTPIIINHNNGSTMTNSKKAQKDRNHQLKIATWNCDLESKFIKERSERLVQMLYKKNPDLIALQEVGLEMMDCLVNPKSPFCKNGHWAISHAELFSEGHGRLKCCSVILINTLVLDLISSGDFVLDSKDPKHCVSVTVCGKRGSKFAMIPKTQIMNIQLEKNEDSSQMREYQFEKISSQVQDGSCFVVGDLNLHKIEEDYLPERYEFEDGWRRVKKDKEGNTVFHGVQGDRGSSTTLALDKRFDRILVKSQDPTKVGEKLLPAKIKLFGSETFKVKGISSPLYASRHLGVFCHFRMARY